MVLSFAADAEPLSLRLATDLDSAAVMGDPFTLSEGLLGHAGLYIVQ